MKNEVAGWFSGLTNQQREIAADLRHLVLTKGQGMREDFRWNQPCYYHGNSMVCCLQKSKRHVALGFGKGAELGDPEGLLEGDGSRMRYLKVPVGTRPNGVAVGRLVSRALELDNQD